MDFTQNYMDNIKLLKIFLILVSLIGASACAQNLGSYAHLGNNGKKFTPASKISSKDWNNPKELNRVWQASFIRIPNVNGKILNSTIAEFGSKTLSNGKKYPTVIYLHGCSGYWAGTIRRINFLAENGFAVIAPPSFRPRAPDSARNAGVVPRHQ